MKKIILLIAMFSAIIVIAQVGINTQNPQGIFNIDGEKNNPSSGSPTASQQLDDFTVKSDGSIGIGTTTPQNKLEINSGITDKSGVRLTNVKNNTIAGALPLAVDSNGDVVKSIGAVGTVFIAKVLPDATVGAGFVYLPLQPLYDPENRYNSTTFQWQAPTNDQSIYEVEVSLHRIDGTNPFNIHRPNSATLVNLPTASGQNFYYHYSGISSTLSSNSLLGAANFGILLNNNSGASYTFTSSLVYVARGYWTITIKRIYSGQ